MSHGKIKNDAFTLALNGTSQEYTCDSNCNFSSLVLWLWEVTK